MKKISFEEAIKALDEGQTVYRYEDKIGYDYYYKKDGVLYSQCSTYVKYNASLDSWESTYIETPFEITETGLYKTRDGRQCYINLFEEEYVFGCIQGAAGCFTWTYNGKDPEGNSDLDIIGTWGEE